jgi:hypothetical protein
VPQEILAHGVYDAIGLVAGLVLGYFRKKGASWPAIVAYGLGGATVMALLVFTLTGKPILFHEPPPPTSLENVGDYISQWAKEYGLPVTTLPPNPDKYYFAMEVIRDNWNKFDIARFRFNDPLKERYLSLKSDLLLTPEQLAIEAKLSPDENLQIVEELVVEMAAKSDLGFEFLPKGHMEMIRITRAELISSALTEQVFAKMIEDMDRAVVLAHAAKELSFFRHYPRQVKRWVLWEKKSHICWSWQLAAR